MIYGKWCEGKFCLLLFFKERAIECIYQLYGFFVLFCLSSLFSLLLFPFGVFCYEVSSVECLNFFI